MKVLSFEEYTANQILEKLYLHRIPTTKRPGNLDDIISRMCNAGYTFLGTISMTNTRPKINRPEELVNIVPEQIREKIKSDIPTGMIVMGADNLDQLVEVMSQPYVEKVVKYNDDIYVLWNPDELYFYCVKPDIYSTVFAGYFIETRTKGVEQTLKDNGIEPDNDSVNENPEEI